MTTRSSKHAVSAGLESLGVHILQPLTRYNLFMNWRLTGEAFKAGSAMGNEDTSSGSL